MGIQYTPEQREQMIRQVTGQRIGSLEYEEGSTDCPPHWVATLEDGSEFSFRFMAELI